MLDTMKQQTNKDTQSVELSEKLARINHEAESSTNDKQLKAKVDEVISNFDNSENTSEDESSKQNIIYISDFTNIVGDYPITEHWRIKRYSNLVFQCLTRVLKNTVVLSGMNGYGITTTAMFVAKRIVEGRCPERFNDVKLICVDRKNFIFAKDADEICEILYEILSVLRANEIKKVIIFFDDFEKMPLCFLEEFSIIVEGMQEELEFDMLKFLIGVRAEFFESNPNNFMMSFVKDSTLITMECDNNILDIIKVVRPRIAELSKMHSNVTISDYFLEVYGCFALAQLGDYINYKSFISGIDALFAICENFGDKRVSRKHIRELYLRQFREMEAKSEAQLLRLAKHEAGHAVFGLSISYQAVVMGVNIIGDSDGAEGRTVAVYSDNLEEDKTYDRNTFIDKIAFNLAGRVGQGSIDVGAHGDLLKAKTLAQKFLERVGKDLGENYAFNFESDRLSERFIQEYESKVQELLNEAYAKAQKTLNDEKEVFDEVVSLLLKKKYLTGTELKAIWKKHHK